MSSLTWTCLSEWTALYVWAKMTWKRIQGRKTLGLGSRWLGAYFMGVCQGVYTCAQHSGLWLVVSRGL